jgi:hypothetical protein
MARLSRTKLAVFVVVLVAGLQIIATHGAESKELVAWVFLGICAVASAYEIAQGIVDREKERSSSDTLDGS